MCSRQGILDPKPVLSHGGRVYAPVRAERAVSKAVCFPTRVAQPESAKKLFTDVHALLRRHLAELDPCITAIALTIFASWMSPVLPIAPDSLDRRPGRKPKKSRAADAGCVVPSPPPLGRSEAR